MYLSKMNIIHRDLRSANVLIKGELAKIADFGLSDLLSSGEYIAVTGQFPWRWSAPEVILRLNVKESLKKQMDVYSFGDG